MRCRNCGKLEKTHYDGREHRRGGSWCYSRKRFPPSDERYGMKFETDSHNTGSGK